MTKAFKAIVRAAGWMRDVKTMNAGVGSGESLRDRLSSFPGTNPMTQRLKRGRSGRKILQHGGPGDCPIQTTALPASVTPVCAAGQPGEKNARPVLEFSATGTRQAPLTVRNRRNRRSLPSLARSVALPLVVLPDFLPGRL